MTVKSSISMTDQQASFARGLVEAGRFASVSSVVQQGLELLREHTESKALEADALRTLLNDRQKRAFISSSSMSMKIAEIASEKRRAKKL
ncbi:MAG: type II toxin-antitoxin system ParD family antitoxin [Alphaproteobacteria bacterium]|nr:MAG: type II toxin-antitoxin system ParD family antitoxin [Alphaproteobacteria bacterium]